MGRLDRIEFEDVFNRSNKTMKMNAHDVYLSQFDWFMFHYRSIPRKAYTFFLILLPFFFFFKCCLSLGMNHGKLFQNWPVCSSILIAKQILNHHIFYVRINNLHKLFKISFMQYLSPLISTLSSSPCLYSFSYFLQNFSIFFKLEKLNLFIKPSELDKANEEFNFKHDFLSFLPLPDSVLGWN